MKDQAVNREDVQPAVVVEVEPGSAKTGVRQRRSMDADPDTLLSEDAGTIVNEDVAALPGQFGHDDVIVAIVVEVSGIDAHARLGRAFLAQRRAGEQGSVLKGSVALIDPQLILMPVVGHVQVRPTVPVEVSSDDPERTAKIRGHTCRSRDISERAVAIVVKEVIGLRAADTWGEQ